MLRGAGRLLASQIPELGGRGRQGTGGRCRPFIASSPYPDLKSSFPADDGYSPAPPDDADRATALGVNRSLAHGVMVLRRLVIDATGGVFSASSSLLAGGSLARSLYSTGASGSVGVNGSR